MTIAEALTASAYEAKWSPEHIAATCGVSGTTARRWLTGESIPHGDKLLILQRELRGFADRLQNGGPRASSGVA